MKKKVIIIGAGPGGLTAGMLLQKNGFAVEIYEKENRVGGRNRAIEEKGFKFDVGPTFLMMKYILDEMFTLAGRKSEDYLKFQRLDPMYQLKFDDFSMDITTDYEKMKQEIKKNFPGEEAGLDLFLKKESKRFDKIFKCLDKDYSSFKSMFSKNLLAAIPYLSIGKSLYEVLGEYFKSDKLKLSFTFQAKYLGMSPWDCPGFFAMLSYVEHRFGIYHVEGGLSEISEKMAQIIEEDGGKIHLNSPVEEILIEDGSISGIKLSPNKIVTADEYILNADFAYSMINLVKPNLLKKYTKEKVDQLKYSCSTFMLYLGLDKIYDEPHHQIIFAKDYKENLEDISKHLKLSKDISIYIRNASINDKTIAPENKSALYILVPVPNNKSKIDWEKEKNNYREMVISTIKKRTQMKDIEEHIEFEKIITPENWEKDENVYFGATFNLAHNLMQMLYFRPRNKFEELDNLYLVGGGTHPGSGLPTIYESAKISALLLQKKYQNN